MRVATLKGDHRVQVVSLSRESSPLSPAVLLGRGVDVGEGELRLGEVVFGLPEIVERDKVFREGEVEACESFTAQLVPNVLLCLQKHLLGFGRLAERCVL